MLSEYVVEGMTCEHCERRVSTEISAVQGVLTATADHSTGTVTVESAAPLEVELVRAAVDEAGYRLADA